MRRTNKETQTVTEYDSRGLIPKVKYNETNGI